MADDTSTFDMTAAQQQAQDANNAWASYDAAQQRYAKRNIWDVGWKAPTAPSTSRYEGDLNDQAALQDWANQANAQASADQQWYDSMLNPWRYSSQTGSVDAYARAAQSDIENYRRVVEENKAQANQLRTDTESTAANAQGTLESTFGKDASNRVSDINSAVSGVQNDVQTVRAKAEESYQATLANIQKLNDFATSSVNWTDEQNRNTLNKLRNDVAQQLDTARTSIKKSAAISMQDSMAKLQAAGYSMDSPQATAEARKIAFNTIQQIGQTTSGINSAYNQLRAETANKATEIGSTVRSQMGTLMAQGAQLGEQAGQARTTAYSDTNKTLADIAQWGEDAKTTALYNYNQVQNAIDTLKLQGDGAAAQLFTSANQWVGESPFVSQMISLTSSYSQQNKEDIYNSINIGMSLLGMALDFKETEIMANAQMEASNDAMMGQIFGGLTSAGGSIGGAAIGKWGGTTRTK